MKKSICLLLALSLLAGLAACAPRVYTPTGEKTGNAELDEAVLTLLQEICDAKASDAENLGRAYDFVANEITYRAGTADTSGGFTDELTNELALALLQKRKGNCDAQAALMAVLLRRMGCEATVVQGTFLRTGEQTPVDHAWVYAVVNGSGCYFDPLYGGHYAEEARDYCMVSAEKLSETHQWDAPEQN